MKNKLIHKKIGIWGCGRVGKAVAQFLHHHGYVISVLDKHFDETTQVWLTQNNIPFFYDEHKIEFLDHNDFILPSPGIDLRQYNQNYKHKWIAELDLFQGFFNKPIIAVTGTVGKTTVTHLLSQLLEKLQISVATGGNIGTASFNLLDFIDRSLDTPLRGTRDEREKKEIKKIVIDEKCIKHPSSARPECFCESKNVSRDKQKNIALLEVSSFQLEHCITFAPDLAIWTNFAANHLDRHSTEQEYFDAKYQIIAHQKNNQKALVPLDLYTDIKKHNPKSQLHFFTTKKPEHFNNLTPNDTVFYLDNNQIIHYHNGTHTNLFDLHTLPPITFAQNWLIICVALHLLKQPLEQLASISQSLSLPEHRLELIQKNNALFFNDSKSTTPTSTLAAIDKLLGKPLILFLGGLSKGIDRAPLIAQLQHKVKHVYCFGAEADQLHTLCRQYGISADHFATLDDAFNQCVQRLESGDHVLFSPAGSSFDLFKNYEERGAYFKKLVGECNDSKQKTDNS